MLCFELVNNYRRTAPETPPYVETLSSLSDDDESYDVSIIHTTSVVSSFNY